MFCSCLFLIQSNNHPLSESYIIHNRTQTITPTATLGGDATTMTPKMLPITFQNSTLGTKNAAPVITANKK